MSDIWKHLSNFITKYNPQTQETMYFVSFAPLNKWIRIEYHINAMTRPRMNKSVNQSTWGPGMFFFSIPTSPTPHLWLANSAPFSWLWLVNSTESVKTRCYRRRKRLIFNYMNYINIFHINELYLAHLKTLNTFHFSGLTMRFIKINKKTHIFDHASALFFGCISGSRIFYIRFFLRDVFYFSVGKMAVEKANEAKTASMEENKENTIDEGLALESILLGWNVRFYENLPFVILV